MLTPIDPTPPVSCEHGAPMGRGWNMGHAMARHVILMYRGKAPTTARERRHLAVAQGVMNPSTAPKCALRHVPLDGGGYDRGGAYWGLGGRL